jgi:hypothetical protein
MTSTVINKCFAILHDAENKEAPKIRELVEAAEKFIYMCIAALKT